MTRQKILILDDSDLVLKIYKMDMVRKVQSWIAV
jgi:hypothetical protein